MLWFPVCLAALALGMWVVLRRPRPQRFAVQAPVTEPAEPWESDPDAWQKEPDIRLETAVWYPQFGMWGIGCPKCAARNAIRAREQLPPVFGTYHVRSRDRAIWCRLDDEMFTRCSEDTILRALDPPAEAA